MMALSDRIIEWLKHDRATAWLSYGTLLVVGLTFVLAILYGPDILNSTDAVERSTDIAGCRSSYSAAVTEARTDFDIARSHRDSAVAELSLLTNELTEKAVFEGRTAANLLRISLPKMRADVRLLNVKVARANDALDHANSDYQKAVALSREDADSFLAACHDDDL